VSASQACKSALATARSQRSVLIMPVFDGVSGNGAHTTYHLGGLSAFVLTGYALPGASAASSLTGSSYCHGSDKCLYGYRNAGQCSGLQPGGEGPCWEGR
jgi:hypothetical protein